MYNDLGDFSMFVEDRVIGGVQGDLLAVLADARELLRLEPVCLELIPELDIFGTGLVGRLDEHAVMLAADFRRANNPSSFRHG